MKSPTIIRLLFALIVVCWMQVARAEGRRVAIIGGGMTGIAAATFLKGTTHEVHLFETEAQIGGNAKTIVIKNADGQPIAVDLGPQYFAEGAWDLYIDFLRYFGLYNPNDFIGFKTSLLITKDNEEWPIMATPRAKLSHLTINICRNNLANLAALKELMDRSHELYQAQTADTQMNVAEWLSEMPVEEKTKREVFLPFLASILGTTIAQTKELSALSLANLYAFRSPTLCQKNDFFVSKKGMGEIIRTMGQEVQKSKNVVIHTSSPITKIARRGENRYIVEIGGDTGIVFDDVILATHATEAAKILTHPVLSEQLASLPYISARLVLHTDHSSTFVNNEFPSHFNIILNESNEVMTTMNLEEIDSKRYRGLLKSWVNSDDVFWLMSGVLHSVTFHHPLMTPYFLQTVDAIKDGFKNDAYDLGKTLALAGAWTEIHETQNTAILSAYKAVSSLGLLTDKEREAWEKRLRLTERQ